MSDVLSRRDVIGKLAAGTMVACTAGIAGTSLAAVDRAPNVPIDALGTEATGDGSRAFADPVASSPLPPDHSSTSQAPTSQAATSSATESAPPWELLRPLKEGAVVGHGWRVSELTPVVHGACVLTLENARGRTQRVHLCANAGRPQGLVYTRRFDLVVMNGGQGDLPTEEGLAQAVAQVAHVLAANERRTEVTALLPHVERVERFASAAALR